MASGFSRIRSAGGTALVAGAAALVAFASTLAPTVSFGDAGELIAVAGELGVAHPPGYPWYTLLLRAALALPGGEPALRTNAVSAVFGATACALVAWLVRRVTGSAVAGIAAGLALAGSASVWAAATTTEVYAAHVALLAALLACAHVAGSSARAGRRRGAVVLGAIVLGLGLAHHPTIVLALPAALALAGGDAGSRLRPEVPWRTLVLAAALAAALAALLYLTLLARVARGPAVSFGRPLDLGDLWAHATALGYRHLDLGWPGLLRAQAWQRLARSAISEATIVALALAAIGVVLGARIRGAGRPARLAAAAALLVFAGAVFGMRYAVPDYGPFFLPVTLGVVLAAGLGVAALRARPRPALRHAGLVAAVLLALAPLAANLGARRPVDSDAARANARDILGTVPSGGLLLVESDEMFPVLYVHHVLGERADIALYDRWGLVFRDPASESGVAILSGEDARAWRLRAETVFLERALAAAPPRDVYFLGWPGYEPDPRYRLEPVGLLTRLARAGDPPRDVAAVWAGYDEARVRAHAARTGEPIARAAAATYPLGRGTRALFAGDRAAARAELEDAARLAADQATILSYIGTLYGRVGDLPAAIAMFERALAVQPSLIDAWANLALAHELAGDRDAAKRARERAAALGRGGG